MSVGFWKSGQLTFSHISEAVSLTLPCRHCQGDVALEEPLGEDRQVTGLCMMWDAKKNWVVVSIIVYFQPYLGKIPILTNIFQVGWNHQLENLLFSIESWLFYGDPYDGSWNNPHITG